MLSKQAPVFNEVRTHLVESFRDGRYRVDVKGSLGTLDISYKEIKEFLAHIEKPPTDTYLDFRIMRARTHNFGIRHQDPWFVSHRLVLKKVPLEVIMEKERQFQDFVAAARSTVPPQHQQGAAKLAIRMLSGLPPFHRRPQRRPCHHLKPSQKK